MTAPERIWAYLPETYGSVKIGTCADTVRYQPHGTEYILHTPADAQAALTAIERAAWERGVRDAAQVASRYNVNRGSGSATARAVTNAILALLTQEGR